MITDIESLVWIIQPVQSEGLSNYAFDLVLSYDTPQAVSIFIDMDESGGRANEWIYK